MDFQLSLDTEGVGSAYPSEPFATTPDATIAEVLRLLKTERTGAILVCEDSLLVGIFTERDALKLMAEGVDLNQPLSSVMKTNPKTINATDTVGDAIKQMSAGNYRHLPIVDGRGEPMGTVGVHGLVHYLVEHFPNTVYNLPPNPNPSQGEREGA